MDVGGVGHIGYEIKISDNREKSFGVLAFSIWETHDTSVELLERPKYQCFKIDNLQKIIKYQDSRFYMLPYSVIQDNNSITQTSHLDSVSLDWKDVTDSKIYKTQVINPERNAFEIVKEKNHLYIESFGHEGSGLRLRPFLLENNINTDSFCVLFKKRRGYDTTKGEPYTDTYAWIRNKKGEEYGDFVYGGAVRGYNVDRGWRISGSFLEMVLIEDGHVNTRECIVYNNLYFTHNDMYFLSNIIYSKKTENKTTRVKANVKDYHNSYKIIIGGEVEPNYKPENKKFQLSSTDEEKDSAKQKINITSDTRDSDGRKLLKYKSRNQKQENELQNNELQNNFNIWNSVFDSCTGSENTEHYTFVATGTNPSIYIFIRYLQ